MRFNPLPFEFLQIFDLDVAQVAVDVDDDGDGHGRFRSADADGEQGEEEALQLTRKQKTVEYHEIDIYRIEDQFHRDQHRQQVAARDEPVDSHEHHDRRNDQVILHVYHKALCFLAFAGDHDTADDAGKQQQADHLERQDISVLVAAHQRMADRADRQFAVLEVRRQEVVLERNEETDAQAGQCCGQTRHELVALELLGLVALARGEQNREDVEHRDAAGVDEQLHGPEERIVELEIDAGRTEEHEQQVGRRTQDTPRRNGQHGAHRDEDRQHGENDQFESYLHGLLFVQDLDQFLPRVDRVFELRRKADGSRRAGIDAQVAEHA